jgi:hypothetical protein
MTSAAVPLNREQRRRQGVKTAPETITFSLMAKRVEYEREDGAVMVKLLGIPVSANGRALLEDEAVGGPEAFIFESQPIMVKKPSGIVTAQATPSLLVPR